MTPSEKAQRIAIIRAFADAAETWSPNMDTVAEDELEVLKRAARAVRELGGPTGAREIFIAETLMPPECFWSGHARRLEMPLRVRISKQLRRIADIFDPDRVAGDA